MATYLNSEKLDELSYEIGQENLPVLLDIFIGELNSYHLLLCENNEDLERHLGEISHALKSSAASFGADELCQLATGIDAYVKAGHLLTVSEHRDSMISSIEKTIAVYGSLFKE